MCRVSVQLIELVKQRLSAATEEIFALLERSIAAYEDETERQRIFLEQLLQPRVQLHRVEGPCESPHIKGEQAPGTPHIKEEQAPGTPHIKEEQNIITAQLWSDLKLEEPLSAPAWDTNSSPPQTLPVVGCVSGSWGPSLTLTKVEEEPLPHIQREEEPLPHIQSEEAPLSPTQSEEAPLSPTQSEEAPLSPTQSEEAPLSPTQSEEAPLSPTQSEEEPLFASLTEEEQWMPTQIEKKPLIFFCSICSKGFTFESELVLHLRLHSEENPFKCSVCMKSFKWKHHLRRHIKRVHASRPQVGPPPASCVGQKQERSRSCVFCSKAFHSKYHLERHMRVHTGEKPFRCSLCEKLFSQQSSLNVHLRSFHSNMSEHENSAARAPPEDSTEPAGGSTALQTSLFLKKHLDESYSRQRPHNHRKCPKCGKSVHTSRFSRHLLTHTGEKPFRCSICGNNFSRKDALHAHMIVHSDEKPFACSVCGILKKRKAELRQHMLTQHPPLKASGAPGGTSQSPIEIRGAPEGTSQSPTGIRGAPEGTSQSPTRVRGAPGGTSQSSARASQATSRVRSRRKQACPICGKVVAFLSKHVKTHSVERPFACSVCGRSFTRKDHLQRHKMLHTRASSFHKKQDSNKAAPSFIYCQIDE